MVKVKILSKCSYCEGKAYLPFKEDVDTKGEKYMRYLPCPGCHGSGQASKWIPLPEFQQLIQESCAHEHVTSNGGFHFTAGEIWDDIAEVCSDCGKALD